MSDPWRHLAACNGEPTDNWFPDTAGCSSPGSRRAIATCRSCPVQLQCLTHAQDKPELHGIWGGLTERQRLGLRREHVVIEHGTRAGYLSHLRYGRPSCQACKDAYARYQAGRRREIKKMGIS